MSSVSIVVTGDSPAAAEVHSLVTAWTRAGITEPSLWVRGSQVISTDGSPPQVTARLATADGEETVDLFAYLGRFRLERVRVVVAQLATTEQDADPEVSALGALVSELITQALPRDPSGRDLTRLHRTLLLVPASDVSGVDSRVLVPGWEANVVISPEDRPDLDRSSVFVRPSTNYAGHAAAAVCAAAGIVRGVPAGAFDDVSTDSSTSPDDVVVARVAVRTVVGDDVLDVFTRRALDPAELAPVGPGQVVPWARPAGDHELVVGRAVRSILTTPEWAPTPAPADTAPPPERERFVRASARAARFNVRTVGAVVGWTFSRGRDLVDQAATAQVVGTDAGAVVTLGPRVVDRMDEVAREILDAQRAGLAEALTYEATRAAPPAPTTWSLLRRLSFALADGGPVEGMDTPRQLGRREVLEPWQVAPRPGASFTTRDGRTVEATDPPAMRALRTELATQLRNLEGEAEALRRRVEAESAQPPVEPSPEAGADEPSHDEQPEPPGEQTADHGAQETDPGQPATDPGEQATDPGGRAIDRTETERRLDTVEEELTRVREECDAYGSWFDEVSSSLLWRVGDDVARRLDETQNARQSFDASQETTAPATAALDAAKRRLLRRWWTTLGLAALALVVMAVVVGKRESPDWWDVAMWTAAVIGATVAVLAMVNHAFYKAFRRYEWRIRNALAAQAAAAARFLWLGKEQVRLRVLYEGWRDWTTIVSEVLHRPWQPPAPRTHDLPEEVVAKLPAAMAAARQQEEQVELPPTLLARAWATVYREGWAQQAFDATYEHLAEEMLLTGASGYLDVDVDTAPSAVSPRGQLREIWCSGRARALLADRQADRLREAVHDSALTLPLRRVTRMGPHSDHEWRDEPDYFAALATSQTTFALDVFGSVARAQHRHYAHHVRVWLPRSAHPEAAPGSDPALRVEPAHGTTALRVDLSRRLRPRDLAVFAPTDDGPTTPTTRPMEDALGPYV